MAEMGKRVRLSTASCPSCGGIGSLKKIVYGMPNSDFDFERYIVGGCCVTEDDPDIGCVQCGWKGMRQSLFYGESTRSSFKVNKKRV